MYIGSTDNHLYALNTETGELRWKYKVNDKIYSSPTVAAGKVVFNSVNGEVFAVQ